MNTSPKNVQIQFAVGTDPSIEDQLKSQEASGVVTKLPAKSATITTDADGNLVATPNVRLTVETGITPVQASLDTLTKKIESLNSHITELQNRIIPTNKVGTPTTDPQRFAANIAEQVQRLERQRQPLLDAREYEFKLAVAKGDTNLYQADNPTLSDEALAELVVKGEAMDQNGIVTKVTSIPGGPVSVEVSRASDGEIALDYLSKS